MAWWCGGGDTREQPHLWRCVGYDDGDCGWPLPTTTLHTLATHTPLPRYRPAAHCRATPPPIAALRPTGRPGGQAVTGRAFWCDGKREKGREERKRGKEEKKKKKKKTKWVRRNNGAICMPTHVLWYVPLLHSRRHLSHSSISRHPSSLSRNSSRRI